MCFLGGRKSDTSPFSPLPTGLYLFLYPLGWVWVRWLTEEYQKRKEESDVYNQSRQLPIWELVDSLLIITILSPEKMLPFPGNEGRKSRIILSLFFLVCGGRKGNRGRPVCRSSQNEDDRECKKVPPSFRRLKEEEGKERKQLREKDLFFPNPSKKHGQLFVTKKNLNRKNGLKNCSYICAHVEYTVWPNKIALLISRTWSGLGSPPPCCFLPSSSFPCPTRESRQDEEKGKERRRGYENNSLFFLWPRKKVQTSSAAAVKNCGTESKTLRQKYHHRWKREESPVM